MELFAIHCTTCTARLKVRDVAAIGHIVACPKCGGMVQVTPPPGWTPPDPAASVATTSSKIPSPLDPSAPTVSAADAAASGITIKIPAAQLAAFKAKQQAAAAAKRATAESAAVTRPAAVPTAASVPSAAPTAAVSSIAVPPTAVSSIAATTASFASRTVAGLKRNWILCVSAPVAAAVIALLAWIIFRPGATADVPAVVDKPAPATAIAGANDGAPSPQVDPAAAAAVAPAAADAIDVAADAVPHAAPAVADAAPAVVAPEAAPAADVAGVLKADNRDPAAVAGDLAPPAGADAAAATAEPAPPAIDLVGPIPAQPGDIAVAGSPAIPPSDAIPAAGAVAKPVEEEAPITHELVPQVEVDARLADPLSSLEFKRVPLADFCDFLSRMSTVPITIDVDALTAAGMHVSDLLVVQAHDTTIGEALSEALAKRGLVHVVAGNQVIVTTLDRKSEGLSTVRYDVSDLAPDAAHASKLSAEITRFVAPGSWQDQGGKANLRVTENVLVVNQTPLEQRRVAALLDRLRQARNLPMKENLRPDESMLKSHYARVRAVLDKPVTCNFAIETPLTEILAWLARASGTPGMRILVDEASLADAGLWSGWSATLVSDRQPLHEALAALLKPQEMSFRVVDERTLQVFARRSLTSRYECELYPVAELLSSGISPDDLLKKLCEKVGNEYWAGTSPAAIELDADSKHLLVMQSPEVQIRVENLLDKAKAGIRGR